MDEHEPSLKELLGVVEMGEPDDSAEVSGTIFDPEHPVWSSGPEEWAETPSKVEQEIEKAIRNLTVEGVFQTSTTKSRGGEPLEMKVSVRDV